MIVHNTISSSAVSTDPTFLVVSAHMHGFSERSSGNSSHETETKCMCHDPSSFAILFHGLLSLARGFIDSSVSEDIVHAVSEVKGSR